MTTPTRVVYIPLKRETALHSLLYNLTQETFLKELLKIKGSGFLIAVDESVCTPGVRIFRNFFSLLRCLFESLIELGIACSSFSKAGTSFLDTSFTLTDQVITVF